MIYKVKPIFYKSRLMTQLKRDLWGLMSCKGVNTARLLPRFFECGLSNGASKLFAILGCFNLIILLSFQRVISYRGLRDQAIKMIEVCCRSYYTRALPQASTLFSVLSGAYIVGRVMQPLYCETCLKQCSVCYLFIYFTSMFLVFSGCVNQSGDQLCATQIAVLLSKGTRRTRQPWCASPSGDLHNGKSYVFIFTFVLHSYLFGLCTHYIWVLLVVFMPIPTGYVGDHYLFEWCHICHDANYLLLLPILVCCLAVFFYPPKTMLQA